jgi:hypothetical protein
VIEGPVPSVFTFAGTTDIVNNLAPVTRRCRPRLRVDPEGVARERNDANGDGRNDCLSHDNYNGRVPFG